MEERIRAVLPSSVERYRKRRDKAKNENEIRLFISFLSITIERAAFKASEARREAFDGIEDANPDTLSRVL